MKWQSWFRRKKPVTPSLTACPKCGREMELIDRTTMTGSDMRTYRCEACDEEHIVDYGTALWQALSDAREEREAGQIDTAGPLA